jgi:hypothetical protein
MFELYPEQRAEGEVFLMANLADQQERRGLCCAKVAGMIVKANPFRCRFIYKYGASVKPLSHSIRPIEERGGFCAKRPCNRGRYR